MKALLGAAIAASLFSQNIPLRDNRNLHRDAERVAKLQEKLKKATDRFNRRTKPLISECSEKHGQLQIDGFGNYVCLPLPQEPIAK